MDWGRRQWHVKTAGKASAQKDYLVMTRRQDAHESGV